MADALHVYLLLDISASMTGAPLVAMRQGVRLLESAISSRSARPAMIAAIAYESTARLLFAPTESHALPPLPPFEAAGSSGLGGAFRLLADLLDKTDGRRHTLIYIFTDGEPTDDWEVGLALVKPSVDRMYGIACGMGANHATFTDLADESFSLDDLTDDLLFTTFRAYT